MLISTNYQKIDKCILILTNDKEYNKISDISKNEYLDICTIKDIPVQILKIETYFLKIEKFLNLRFISCDYDSWRKLPANPIINKLAIFQKLSMIAVIDYQMMSFVPLETGYFIWKNKMTMLNPEIIEFENISPTIEYLNIINTQEHDYSNIPDTIQHLHLSIRKLNNYKQTNLPSGLKTITITIPEIYKTESKDEIKHFIISNTKLPFNCELIIDDIY
jgi:hypothetical protein